MKRIKQLSVFILALILILSVFRLPVSATETDGTKIGWYKENDECFFYDERGEIVTGWASISGVWYFFKSNGVMAANEWCDGYWLNANGSWTYKPKGSWKKNSYGWWFGDTSGWYAKNTTIKINDFPYSFNAAGYMKTGWQYYGGNWYYIDSSGSFAKGWKYINNHMYYFLSSGRMATGSIDMNEKTFFLDSNGALLPSLYDDLKSMAYNEIVLWIIANANDTVSGNPAYTETYKGAEQTIYSDSTDGFIRIERVYNTGTTITAGAINIWENDEYSFVYQEVYNSQTDDFDIWGNAYIADASFDLNYQIDFKLYEGDPGLQRDTENMCSESCYNSLLWLNHITDRDCLDINCTTLGFYSMTY